MSRQFRLYLALASFFLLLDQAVKIWARQAGGNTEGRMIAALWPGVFELKLVFNHGIAFGMFQGGGIMFVPLALLIGVGAGFYVLKHPEEGSFVTWTAALLTSGAIGNLIDRVAFGKVTDIFWFSLINFPVFNVADSCITVAGAFLVLNAFREMLAKGHGAQASEPEATPDATSPATGE